MTVSDATVPGSDFSASEGRVLAERAAPSFSANVVRRAGGGEGPDAPVLLGVTQGR